MSMPTRLEEPRPATTLAAPGSSLSAVTTLLLGVVGMVMGIGVGLRWLRAGAADWKTLLGILALGIGVLLSGLGVARIGRDLPTTAKIATRTLVILVLAVVVWTLTPAVIATNVPPAEHGIGPGELGPSARDARFLAEDGTELFAWYVPPTQGKVAVLRHGSGSTASDVIPHARVLLNSGYGVLLTDARGHGESEGTGMDFGWHGEADIAAAIDFLTSQPEVDPDSIVVVGLSMGGEEAIGAIGADSRIAAVVAEGASARNEADKAWLADVYGWRGWVQVQLEWLQYTVTDLLTAAPKPDPLAESAAVASPRPILMVAAGNIEDEANAARHVQGTAGGNVSLWIVPGADHIGGLATSPEKWEQTVIGFLDSAVDT